MNYLDIIIVIVVGFLTFTGMRKGFVSTLAGIIGFFAALIIATGMMGAMAEVLQSVVNFSKGPAYLVSYIILFFGVIIIFKIAAKIIQKLFTVTSTKWVDQIGGGAFGFLLGGLIVSTVLNLLAFFPFSDKLLPEQENAILYPYAVGFAPGVYDLVVKMGPMSQKFEEITEDILKGEPIEFLKKTKAGRNLLEYWEKIKRKAEDLKSNLPPDNTAANIGHKNSWKWEYLSLIC